VHRKTKENFTNFNSKPMVIKNFFVATLIKNTPEKGQHNEKL
jgi:hypothetical protein